TTASLHYGAEGDRPWALTFLWGRNAEDHGTSDSLLAEAAWQATARDHLYARAGWVEKDLELLATKHLHDDDDAHGGASEDEATVPVKAFTAGYVRSFDLWRSVNVGLGADITLYGVDPALHEAYGSWPVSTHVFARLRWGRPHGASAHAGH
ncbi:hypothetical protein QUV00_22820, partial [Xanthomonas citri pv. citri]